jgi:hypothetical protein
MLILRASRLLIVLATMMFWTFSTANATTSDKDGDGLLNGQERNVTHTSPVKADTDGTEDGDEDGDEDDEDEDDQGEDEQ